MPELDLDLLLGRLAVHFRLLDKARLVEVIQAHRKSASELDLGAFLVSAGDLTPEQLTSLIAARRQYIEKKGLAAEAAAAPAASPPTAAQTIPMPTIAESEGPALGALEAPATAPPVPVPVTRLPPSPRPRVEAPAQPPPVAAVAPPRPASAEPVPVPVPSPAPDPVPSAPEPLFAEEVAPAPSFPEPAFAPATGELPYRAGVELDELLRAAVAMGASDVHLHSGSPLKVRLHGTLRDASAQPLADGDARRLIHGVLNERQRAILAADYQLDFAHHIPGVARFRANAYAQQRGLDAVFRVIPVVPPTLEELGLPFELGAVSQYHQGMVLFTGPAGCGKSSSMAAIVELANQRRSDHVLTVEDPIEFVFESKKALVNQRQVGPHTESFARALRAALREDPDVVVIGELRDLETISLALTAAETGHLVLGTLHTSGAIRTVNRLLGVFPPDQQAQIRTMVSESLRAIISQRLVARADGGGRIPALEILYNNKAIGNLIRENKTFQLRSVMQTGASAGMCLLDASLAQLVRSGKVTLEEARRHAEEPAKLG